MKINQIIDNAFKNPFKSPIEKFESYLKDRYNLRLNVMLKMFIRGIPMIIISLSLIELISYKMSSNQIEQLTKEQELTLTNIHVERLDSIINNMEDELISVRNMPSLITFHENSTFKLMNEAEAEKKQLEDFFIKTNERSKTETMFRFIYKDGEEKIKVLGKNILGNLKKGINLEQVMSSIKVDTSEKIEYKFVFQNEINQYSITMLLPVIVNNVPIAVIEMSRGIDSILNSLKKERVFKNGYLAIFSKEGKIIYHPNYATNDVITDRNLKKLLNNIIKDRAGNYTSDIFGSSYITGFSPMEHYPWYVVAFAPQEEMLAVLTNIKNIVITLVSISIALGILLIYFFMRNVVVGPLNRILDATRQVKVGNLDVQADISSNSSDEISELGISFNEMIYKLKQQVDEIKEYNKNLEQKINERTAELNEQNRKVSNLLNNMQQSVFTINENEIIFAPVSKYSESIFGKVIENKNVFELLYKHIDPKSEEYSLIKTAFITIFGNSRLQWKLMESNLPIQVNYIGEGNSGDKKEKILHVTYTPIFDSNDMVEQLMFVVDDVTEIKNLEQKIEKQKTDNAKNLQILQELSSKEIYDVESFFNGVFRLLDDCQKAAEKQPSISELQSVFRNIHTIKGNSRILGFNIISQTTHRIESELNLSAKSGANYLTVESAAVEKRQNSNISLNDIKQKIDQIYCQVMEYFNYAHKLFKIKNTAFEENLTACHLEMVKLETELGPIQLIDNYLNLLVDSSKKVSSLAKKVGHKEIIQNCNDILSHINEKNRENNKNLNKKFIINKYNLLGSKIKDLYLGQVVKVSYSRDVKIWREVFAKVYLITKAFTKEDSPLIIKSIEELYNISEINSLLYLTTISQLQLKELNKLNDENIYLKKNIVDSIFGYLLNLWDYISLVSLLETGYKLTATKREILLKKEVNYDDIVISTIIHDKNGLADFFDICSLVMDISGEELYKHFIADVNTNFIPEIIFEKMKCNYLGSIPTFTSEDDVSNIINRKVIQLLTKNESLSYITNIDLCYLFGQYIEDSLVASCTTKVEVVKNNLQELDSILSKFITEKPEDKRMLDLKKQFNKLFETSVKDYLSRYARLVKDVSNNLGKKVKFKVVCNDEITMSNDKLNLVCDGITHLIRNSLDHGIESPEQRRMKGKNEVGELTLEVKEDNDRFSICISDDGSGLDKEAIIKKAIDKKLVNENIVNNYREEQIIDLIFLSGFTTKDNVNELSGRGIGMDVVKSNMKKLGGELSVLTKSGEGTTIKLLVSR
ncbi:MAG: Cache 3/Cache 2 fusion domain-containing protein [Oligoflexia bacterium]|nr:Cache 3/Cache 2 fusion domain-containing protein [Oligoflexia bacterium]